MKTFPLSILLVSSLILCRALTLRADVIVTVDSSQLFGHSAQLAFDFIGGPDANVTTISGFSTNGSLGPNSPSGGVSGMLPGTVTLTDAIPADFFNEYLTDITLGTTFSFVLSATTIGPPSGSSPDAFSLFILNPSTGLSLVTTTDPTGSDSLLTLNIDGSPEGNLDIYSSNSVTVAVMPVGTTPVPEPSPALFVPSVLVLLAIVAWQRVHRLGPPGASNRKAQVKGQGCRADLRLRHKPRASRFQMIWLAVLALFLGPFAAAQTFVDISAQVTVTKSGLVLNRATNTFNSVVTVTNTSTAIINGPLVLNVSNITPATITLANPAGQAPSGTPYINLNVPPNGLSPGASISKAVLEFNDPGRIGFTFGLSVAAVEIPPDPLPTGAIGPIIESVPPTAAVAGKSIQYQVVASSASPSSLAFSLSVAPTGMTINSTTGVVAWTPGVNQTGDHPITVVAQDSTDQTTQSFVLSVFGTNTKASATISAASGGVITVNDPTSTINGLSLTIPAGALATDTKVTISELISPPTLGGTTHFWMQGFAIDPDETLAAPATVTIPYDPTQFGTQDGIALESFLGVYFVASSTGDLQFLTSYSTNTSSHILTASLPHFSVWEITNVARLCPPIGEPGCPSSYSPPSPSLLLPAVMVHGFQLGGMGDEGTWGNLRTLLGSIDTETSGPGPGRIDAWRFDWDSRSAPFEATAQLLWEALLYVESKQTSPPPHLVNIVAHSFGGILARTYLEGKSDAPYSYDVNRLMTLGTPHTGIGGNLSTWIANRCARNAQFNPLKWLTCFEVGTGQCPQTDGAPGACATGEGEFLLNLNDQFLPNLQSSVSPSYRHVKGRTFLNTAFGQVLQQNDGLITIAGAQLCGGSPTNVCTGANVEEQEIPGLCHSSTLLNVTCAPVTDVPMAQVEKSSHPLWQSICQFLGCGPAINVTISNASGGTVTSDSGGIKCGPTCSAVYAGGTASNPVRVTLTAHPNPGFDFTGWSGSGVGSCSTQPTCKIAISNDYQNPSGRLFKGYPVTAAFSAISTCAPQTICGTVTDYETGTVKLAGVPIVLLSATGTELEVAYTNNAGSYSFTSLTAPGYLVYAVVSAGEFVTPFEPFVAPGSAPTKFQIGGVPENVTVTGTDGTEALLTTIQWTNPSIPPPNSPYFVLDGSIFDGSTTLSPSNTGGVPKYWLTCFVFNSSTGSYTETTSVQLPGLKANGSITVPCPP